MEVRHYIEIAILPFLVFLLYHLIKERNKNKSSFTPNKINSSICKLDDKNYIINGKFVSLEEDTEVTRMQQRFEDDKLYNEYESYKLNEDRNYISDLYFCTQKFIRDKKHIKLAGMFECNIDQEKIEVEYGQYVKMAVKLNEGMYTLTFDEFVISKRFAMWCSPMRICFPPMCTYSIYNEKTARYYKGDMSFLMAKEFKSKWY